jgi:hypothetical protein
MRAMRLESHAAPPSEMTEQPPTPPSRHRLRSRAEQIADELAAQNRHPEPTVRRLPGYEPTDQAANPGR